MFGTVENCADDPANLDAEISGPSPNLHVVVRGTKRSIRALKVTLTGRWLVRQLTAPAVTFDTMSDASLCIVFVHKATARAPVHSRRSATSARLAAASP
jgi:hypothetical protein